VTCDMCGCRRSQRSHTDRTTGGSHRGAARLACQQILSNALCTSLPKFTSLEYTCNKLELEMCPWCGGSIGGLDSLGYAFAAGVKSDYFEFAQVVPNHSGFRSAHGGGPEPCRAASLLRVEKRSSRNDARRRRWRRWRRWCWRRRWRRW